MIDPKSWKLGCKTSKTEERWSYNGLRFRTKEECEKYGSQLFSRWTALAAYEAHPCDDDPTPGSSSS